LLIGAPELSFSPFLPLIRRALAFAALLAAPLTPTASLPAEAPPAAGCDAQSMLADPAPAGAAEVACVAPDLERDQAYLVETARPGETMLHQGPALAIVRLHPTFVHRLAEAIGEARAAGLALAGIFSAYRPPAFGVGGFSDKFHSLHTYGLAVDLLGIGSPGSNEARLWYEIAARHGIVCPYGVDQRREWNHCQPTHVKSIMAGDPLRGTVSPRGPLDLDTMFAMGDALVNGTDAGADSLEAQPAIDERSLSRNQGQSRPHRTASRVAANPDPHEAHGQSKRRTLAETAAGKSSLVKKYRTSSLIKRDSFEIKEENARVNRVLKGICRGC
jgi:hypothetical protein